MVVNLFHGIKSDFVQVLCMQDRHLPALRKMGWELTPDDLADEWPQLATAEQKSEIKKPKSKSAE